MDQKLIKWLHRIAHKLGPVNFALDEKKMTKPEMKRFSAKLLFQFRVMVDGDPGKRRLCEERIVHFRAENAKDALQLAKAKGKKAQDNYKNVAGSRVLFDFIGVTDLICCDPACEADEVWYELKERLLPKERKKKLIPPDKDLLRCEMEIGRPTACRGKRK